MKNFIFTTKYFFYRPEAFKFYNELIKSQFLSLEELKKHSFERFIKILKFAYSNSTYYRDKYDSAGINISEIKNYDDIVKIPIITREEIKKNYKIILIKNFQKQHLGTSTTGGSTGIPIKTHYDKRLPLEAFGWRYLNWWGLHPSDDGAYLWRMVRTNKLSDFINKSLWWPTKKIRLNATHLDYKKFQMFRNRINRHKPKLIQGYVGALFEFSEFLKKNDLNIHKPVCVWLTSAPISKIQRIQIEETFNAPVYDEYGSSEIPWLAAQCSKKDLLHINFEGRLIEVVDNNNKILDYEREGKIIVTDLLNYYFPLIRYENGDRGKLSVNTCSCGSNLPLLNPIKGRISDSLRNIHGKSIAGAYLTTIFDDHITYVLNFQLLQTKDYKIHLKIVPNKELENWYEYIKALFRDLKKNIFQDFDIELQFVDQILSERGKTRYIVSELNNYQNI